MMDTNESNQEIVPQDKVYGRRRLVVHWDTRVHVREHSVLLVDDDNNSKDDKKKKKRTFDWEIVQSYTTDISTSKERQKGGKPLQKIHHHHHHNVHNNNNNKKRRRFNDATVGNKRRSCNRKLTTKIEKKTINDKDALPFFMRSTSSSVTDMLYYRSWDCEKETLYWNTNKRTTKKTTLPSSPPLLENNCWSSSSSSNTFGYYDYNVSITQQQHPIQQCRIWFEKHA